MDYFFRIQGAIDYIEENLKGELNIVDIASKAFFSSFYFQRLFQAMSGYSVQEYIRKRKLTEAAKILDSTEISVLDIAVDFGYGSQESFTRAFKSLFDMTPAKYRKADDLNLGEFSKINFLDFANQNFDELEVNKPEIKYLDKVNVVGHEYKTNLNGGKYFQEIPGFYDDFGKNEYYLKIEERLAPAFPHGITCNYCDNGDFSFVIGEMVKSPQENLVDLINLEIPAGEYAVFKVKGSVDQSQKTWKYIYGTWLPNSKYERADGPDFEVVDVLGSVYPDNMVSKIYIPIL
jgi:AraC family transcriptional regulator